MTNQAHTVQLADVEIPANGILAARWVNRGRFGLRVNLDDGVVLNGAPGDSWIGSVARIEMSRVWVHVH